MNHGMEVEPRSTVPQGTTASQEAIKAEFAYSGTLSSLRVRIGMKMTPSVVEFLHDMFTWLSAM